ncbi:MAG: hypothetical protein R3Y56_10545, partial [Akkermansia sp.]
TFEWGLDTSNAKEAYARARILLRILVAAGLSRHNKIHVRDADNDALYNQEYVSAENIEWTRRKRKKRKEMGKKKEYRYKDVPFIKGLEPKKTDEKQG